MQKARALLAVYVRLRVSQVAVRKRAQIWPTINVSDLPMLQSVLKRGTLPPKLHTVTS